MEPTNSSILDDLRSRVSQLQAEIREKDQKTIQAATFGKSLLEENQDLRSQIDSLVKQHAEELEAKQQETCSLQSRIEVAANTENWLQGEVSNLRTELHNAREQSEKEKKRELAAHKKEVDSLRLDVEHLQSVEQELRGKVTDLEALLQTHLDRTLVQSTSSSFSSEEMSSLMEELNNLKIDLTEAQAKIIDQNGQVQQCQREKDTVSGRLKSASEEIEDVKKQALSYSKHLEESRKEVLELRAQLDASRVDSQAHSSKGNSIFSELDDRRQILEKKVASLKAQNQQVVDKLQLEKEQNRKYKMQIAIGLEMTRAEEDPVAPRLRQQLSEAHAEIRALLNKMETSQCSESTVEDRLESGMDKFFWVTLDMERKKVAKAEADLRGKTLQHMDVTQQNVKLHHQIQQLERERDKLSSQLMIAHNERDELLAKYELNKEEEGNPRKRVEKIHLGDKQFRTQETTFPSSGRPSDIFKPCTTTGRPSFVFKPCSATGRPSSVFKPSTTTGRTSDALKSATVSERPSNVLKPVNALERTRNASGHSKTVKPDVKPEMTSQNFDNATRYSGLPSALPSSRKVSMTDDVQVIYADGESSMTVLSGERDSSLAPEPKKKQTRKPPKVIKVDEVAPQLDCKTQ